MRCHTTNVAPFQAAPHDPHVTLTSEPLLPLSRSFFAGAGVVRHQLSEPTSLFVTLFSVPQTLVRALHFPVTAGPRGTTRGQEAEHTRACATRVSAGWETPTPPAPRAPNPPQRDQLRAGSRCIPLPTPSCDSMICWGANWGMLGVPVRPLQPARAFPPSSCTAELGFKKHPHLSLCCCPSDCSPAGEPCRVLSAAPAAKLGLDTPSFGNGVN